MAYPDDLSGQARLKRQPEFRGGLSERFIRTGRIDFFRKSARRKALENAPRNAQGEMVCSTCGEVIPEKIARQTKIGPQERVGYDLDHYPDTLVERIDEMKSREVKPTRDEVLDEYNRDLRVQCPPCNVGHKYEGVEGDYANGVDENGDPIKRD